jgi:hypothetical protein
MAFFDRFTKRWASTGVVTEPTDGQAAAGFAHLGANPPTVEEFNALFQWLDDKDGWLYSNLVELMVYGGQAASAGNTVALREAVKTRLADKVSKNSGFAELGGHALSFGQNGYCKFPNGLIVQWGNNSTGAGGNVNFAFPLAFPTACRAVIAMEASADGWGPGSCRVFGCNLKTTAGMIISSAVVTAGGVTFGGANFDWIAVGH